MASSANFFIQNAMDKPSNKVQIKTVFHTIAGIAGFLKTHSNRRFSPAILHYVETNLGVEVKSISAIGVGMVTKEGFPFQRLLAIVAIIQSPPFGDLD